MVRVGIVGISGYSGFTALTLLLNHPQVRLTYVSANTTTGALTDIWPQLRSRTKLYCEKFSAIKAAALCDIIFLATPHTVSMSIAPKLLAKKLRVIDLSGDYRLKSAATYKKWYGKKHTDTRKLSKAVYGLPEIYKVKIASASLVANPGCYPTAAILALAPLVAFHHKAIDSIIIDAKSGISGAGKKITGNLMYAETNENLTAYKLFHHQHAPEIEQYLSSIAEQNVTVTFAPHLVPLNVGIFETIYVQLNNKFNETNLNTIYSKFYKTEPFVRVLKKDSIPELKNVAGTNFCDIGIAYNKEKNQAIITSAIDNLVKGAAGQAVQNMNLMCGFKETTGLY